MGFDPAALPDEVLAFLADRHLATLTTLGIDGRPHVVAVGFTFDPALRLVRIITNAGTCLRCWMPSLRTSTARARPQGGCFATAIAPRT